MYVFLFPSYKGDDSSMLFPFPTFIAFWVASFPSSLIPGFDLAPHKKVPFFLFMCKIVL